jgi:hypothetical protein
MRHGYFENTAAILLKTLAIPAGFEPATHGYEIRYSTWRFVATCNESQGATFAANDSESRSV